VERIAPQAALAGAANIGEGLTRNVRNKLMSQAESATTTTPMSFASAGAVRRARHAAALPGCQLAHAALMAALAAETPHPIIGHAADRFDIMERAEHLKTVLAAVTTYAKAIVAETADMAPAGYVHDETGYLVDAASEVTGALNSAVDKMLDDADEANPGAWLRARQAEVAR